MVFRLRCCFYPSPCAHLSSLFFFLMIRPPPRSTLFPYRRSSDLRHASRTSRASPTAARSSLRRGFRCGPIRQELRAAVRSEEHTSELQSRENLVCRLLLEKKKKKKQS